MSSGTSGSLEPTIETQARPQDVTNGSADARPAAHRPSSKWLTATEKEDRLPTEDPSNAAGAPRGGTKKSLSFYPDDSSDSSDEQALVNGSEQDNNPIESSKLVGSQPSFQPAEVRLEQTSAVPLESDHEESSSTSSCSCEEHSSEAGGHQEEDPHGDLDYDDDSITNSPADGDKINSVIATLSDQSKDDETSNQGNSDNKNTATDGQQKPAETDIQNSEKSDGPSTKIRSFINTDHGLKNGQKDDSTKKQLKDRSHKSYEGLLKYFFKDTCYFQMKSINHENIQISKSMGVWSTPVQNEVRLNMAFREHRNVILIFSVQRSGAFQGFARMVSDSRPAAEPVPWVLPARLSNATLGGVFQVQWLCTKELDFAQTRDLCNQFNDNKPVKVARDGQEVEPKVGKKLCLLFPRDSKRRLVTAVEQLKVQTKHRKQTFQQNGLYPMNDMRAHSTIAHNRRSINGMHYPTMPNGYGPGIVGPSSSLAPMYSYATKYNDIRGRLAARRRLHFSLHQRRGAPPANMAHNPFQGPAYHDHQMMDFTPPGSASSAAYPRVAPENGYYAEPFDAEYPSYLPRPAPAVHHPRAYQEYSMSPNRYHPYRRARR